MHPLSICPPSTVLAIIRLPDTLTSAQSTGIHQSAVILNFFLPNRTRRITVLCGRPHWCHPVVFGFLHQNHMMLPCSSTAACGSACGLCVYTPVISGDGDTSVNIPALVQRLLSILSHLSVFGYAYWKPRFLKWQAPQLRSNAKVLGIEGDGSHSLRRW